MLLSLYEEDNSAYFKSKFVTPITLPKNAEITLLKAYIPRDQSITIDTTNNSISFQTHDDDNNAITNVSITEGSYGVKEFASMLQALLRAEVASQNTAEQGQLRGIFFRVEAKESGNTDHENDEITIKVEPVSTSANFYLEGGFTDTNTTIVPQGHLKTATDVVTHTLTNDSIRLSVFTDNAGAVKEGWDWFGIIEKNLDRQRFSKTTKGDYANNIPSSNNVSTLYSVKLGDLTDSGVWIGLKQSGSAVDLTGVTTGDMSAIGSIVGIVSCMAVYGKAVNGKTVGQLEIFEDIAGTLTSIKSITTLGLQENDEIIISIPANNDAGNNNLHIEYYVKRDGGTNFLRATLTTAPQRYMPLSNQNFQPAYGIFSTSATPQLKEIKWGMDAGYTVAESVGSTTKGLGRYSNFGRYCVLILNGADNANKDLKTTLGFNDDDYVEDERANADTYALATLHETSTTNLVTNEQRQPFINLNITNLPISSVSCSHANSSDITVGETQHDYSKCVASMPRYNQDDGHYNNDCVIFDNNTQSIKLHNNDEIILSQLDIRLQNCDGTYPTDLLTPSSFVFKISGDNLN